MPKYRYENFLKELRAGLHHGVFIDDTGSPGLHTTYPHPERKSYVAVVVPRHQISGVLCELPKAVGELRSRTGAMEFHFSDIYAGRKTFGNVDLNVRLEIFRFMAHIFSVYRFPVIVQTFDPDSIADIRSRAPFPQQLGPFNLTKIEDMALLTLLFRVEWLLKEIGIEHRVRARVFVDEGFKKNGIAIKMDNFNRCFVDGLVCFARSDTIQPIQLADLAAFCLNRSQLILGKPEPSDLDYAFLNIVSPIAWNYKNIPKGIGVKPR